MPRPGGGCRQCRTCELGAGSGYSHTGDCRSQDTVIQTLAAVGIMKQTEAETVEDTMDTADMKEERRDRDGSDRFCCYDVSQPVIGPVTAEVMKLFNQKYFYI